MIENAGHMVHMEKAAEVNRLVERFVAAAGDSRAQS
jgi:pimeloyl-ACP methyl ester carboxylesterase